MKKKIVVILVFGFALFTAFAPSISYARGYHHGSGGLYAAGALIGGVLLGTVIGSAISQPRYAADPQPAYAYPESAMVYYRPAYQYENPPGEWIIVPGRWVNGSWIPSHRVWAPVNPY